MPSGRRQPGRGRPRRLAPAPDGSRERLLDAAKREFAARGFAGASVDRIAAAARLNKAMIYYHFRSKAALYREVLREMFTALGTRVRDVAAANVSADEKVRRFIDVFAAEAEARPHFPPIWFREIAEGGTHLDTAILMEMAGVVGTLSAILDEGVRNRGFARINPVLVHASIVAPVLLFFASGKLRQRLERSGVPLAGRIARAQVVAHVQRVTLGLLEGRI